MGLICFYYSDVYTPFFIVEYEISVYCRCFPEEPTHFINYPGTSFSSIRPVPDLQSVLQNYGTAWGYAELTVTQVFHVHFIAYTRKKLFKLFNLFDCCI